jgi:hypothetical protein
MYVRSNSWVESWKLDEIMATADAIARTDAPAVQLSPYDELAGRDADWVDANKVVLAQLLSPNVPMRTVAARNARCRDVQGHTVFATRSIEVALERCGFRRVGETAGGLSILRQAPVD